VVLDFASRGSAAKSQPGHPWRHDTIALIKPEISRSRPSAKSRLPVAKAAPVNSGYQKPAGDRWPGELPFS